MEVHAKVALCTLDLMTGSNVCAFTAGAQYIQSGSLLAAAELPGLCRETAATYRNIYSYITRDGLMNLIY